MRKYRNLKSLELALQNAKGKYEKGVAYYRIGLFHDNNSREAMAIPFYKKALQLDLDASTKAKALAWLASSLYKTGKSKQALSKVNKSIVVSRDKRLKQFLVRLKNRIEKTL